MIKRTKVKNVWAEEALCHNCGEVMKMMESLSSYPPIYVYKCNSCGIEERYSEIYPRISYELEKADNDED